MNEDKLTKNPLFYAISGASILVSVLQALLFTRGGHWTALGWIAFCLAGLNLLVAIAFLISNDDRYLMATLLLFCLQIGVFLYKLFAVPPIPASRLLAVAILLVDSAAILSVLLSALGILAPPRAVLLAFLIAAGIFCGETVLQMNQTPTSAEALQWSGPLDSYPGIGTVYRPYSLLKTFYPDNPRGYFHEEDPRKATWWLHVSGGSSAQLSFPPENRDMVRVSAMKAATKTPYDIQLNFSHLKVEAGKKYTIEFRARAENPRSAFVGFARSHDPWDGLGLYKKIDLKQDWKNFLQDFDCTGNDNNTRIHFDLGESDIPVEISFAQLLTEKGGEPVKPDVPLQKFFVDYRFNGLGCRGRDYAAPRPAGTERILFLGDSYTLGVGVHEEDTFSKRLEGLLMDNENTQGSKTSYEVINCGVQGYGTRQERLFYEFFGTRFEPQLVIVVITGEELKKVQPESKPSLFYSWDRILNRRQQLPLPNFTSSVNEILRLDDEVREKGGRLIVVLFRNNSDYQGSTYEGKRWNNLTRVVIQGLQGTNIPVLDLGKALYQKDTEKDLQVYESLDPHPNAVAHAIAAQEILTFLQREKLLDLGIEPGRN